MRHERTPTGGRMPIIQAHDPKDARVWGPMTKVDLKTELDSYRARHGEFRVVDVPPAQYLLVHGQGDPNTAPEYADALAALYPVAYKLKFASKTELDRDYVVMPLEALWWASDMDTFTTARDKSAWHWTAMILVPDWIMTDMYDAVVAEAARKDQPAASIRFDWRRCARAAACRRSTSAPMTTRPRCSLRCTTNSSRAPV